MKQVFILHGGNSFLTYDAYMASLISLNITYDRLLPARTWRDWLSDSLEHTEVLVPQFPNKQNAQYNEWKIYFDKIIPYFGDDVRIIGHSLGAMFIAKYLQEYPLTRKINQLVLLAGGFNDQNADGYGSFTLSSAKDVVKSANDIHLFHSKDDPLVPYSELAKFEADLPLAKTHSFTDRGHFLSETFPELLEVIKK